MTEKEKIKEEVKQLWRDCFGDSEEFIELYFNKRYTDENNIYIVRDDKVISAMQVLEYPFMLFGEIFNIGYISGACTHIDYRNKGMMKDLLKNSFRYMQEKNYPLAILIPAEEWLFEYYNKTDFSADFFINKEIPTHNADTDKEVDIQQKDICDNDIFTYIDKTINKTDLSVLHTESDLEVIFDDLKISSGRCLCAYKDGVIVGIAFIYRRGEMIEIKELRADSPKITNTLINHILEDNRETNKIELHSKKAQPNTAFGMCRIIDPLYLLKLYAKHNKEKSLYIELKDKDIESNSGYYNLNNGECRYSNVPSKESYVKMTTKELSSLIFSDEKAYMNLMMN